MENNIIAENIQRKGGNFTRRATLSTAFGSWVKAVEKFVIIPIAGQKPVYLIEPSRLDALEKAAAAADRHQCAGMRRRWIFQRR